MRNLEAYHVNESKYDGMRATLIRFLRVKKLKVNDEVEWGRVTMEYFLFLLDTYKRPNSSEWVFSFSMLKSNNVCNRRNINLAKGKMCH